MPAGHSLAPIKGNDGSGATGNGPGTNGATGGVPCTSELSQTGYPGHRAGLNPAGYFSASNGAEKTTPMTANKQICNRESRK